jgi:hypothetical protein
MTQIQNSLFIMRHYDVVIVFVEANETTTHHQSIVFHYEQQRDKVFTICLSSNDIKNIPNVFLRREMARRDSFGGYEEERFKDKVDIKLQCSICLKVLKCYCDENSSSRKFPFLLATTLLLHQKCLCKISGEHD